ncbi:MAG: MFS transporter, partial [Gluconacetobacter diazotrophicus]|nr:MFS transporter [Gluconacetobacter diazotrophicus]
ESCVATGSITWAIAIVGPERTAQVISMNGVTSYGGIALGAPVGLLLAGRHGLLPLGLVTVALAAIGLALAVPRPAARQAASGARVAFWRILGTVAPYGLILGSGSVGFGVVAAFVTLFYDQLGWALRGVWGPGSALSAFGIAFIAVRLTLVPQIARRGGLPVAVASLLVEAAGLMLVWRAPAPPVAVLGCAVTGAGFSLLFPALGVLAVATAGARNRGSALGAYSVFLDISIGCSGPLLGLLATGHGYRALFLAATAAAFLGLAGCARLSAMLDRSPPARPDGG